MAADHDEIAPPSKGDLSALRHIAAENVTWRTDARGRTSYRLWSTETHYRTCTPAVKRVIERGWAKRVHGFLHGRGGVDLTDLGRAVLAAHFDSQEATDGR